LLVFLDLVLAEPTLARRHRNDLQVFTQRK
jgi:hypothetical protein